MQNLVSSPGWEKLYTRSFPPEITSQLSMANPTSSPCVKHNKVLITVGAIVIIAGLIFMVRRYQQSNKEKLQSPPLKNQDNPDSGSHTTINPTLPLIKGRKVIL